MTCNKCGMELSIRASDFKSAQEKDLIVQYFSCPGCGKKYQIITTDGRMRELIEARKRVGEKIKASNAKRFRKEQAKRYAMELEDILSEQKKLLLELKKRGEEILNGLDN